MDLLSTNRPTLFLLLLLLLPSFFFHIRPANACYSAIFSFGDSLADTGNLLHTIGKDNIRIGRFPYGETYFHRPMGRFCDGRLVVDFIAQALGLPLLPPYLEGQGSGEEGFRKGVNFAVAGSTALENAFFRERKIKITWTNKSLGIQIQWFKQLLPSLCSDCQDMLQRSLFLVGEIGGNDYNDPFFQGRNLKEIRSFVPRVIGAISSAVAELIKIGARTLVVPGNFPIGCNSAYLTLFQSHSHEIYDQETGCIEWLNEFARYHNSRLQLELDLLQKLHPEATIIYADYYGAAMRLFTSPDQFGFAKALVACCGGGGPYNYNSSLQCGGEGSSLCIDPSKYVYWDGLHLTEAAHRTIADGLLKGPYVSTPILKACQNIKSQNANGTYKYVLERTM